MSNCLLIDIFNWLYKPVLIGSFTSDFKAILKTAFVDFLKNVFIGHFSFLFGLFWSRGFWLSGFYTWASEILYSLFLPQRFNPLIYHSWTTWNDFISKETQFISIKEYKLTESDLIFLSLEVVIKPENNLFSLSWAILTLLLEKIFEKFIYFHPLLLLYLQNSPLKNGFFSIVLYKGICIGN